MLNKYSFAFACRCGAGLLFPLLVAWLTGPAARAQAPAWQSMMSILPGSGQDAYVFSSVVDARGNVYVAGGFYGTASFGASIRLTSGGGEDGFVAKWSPAANDFVWAERLGGLLDDRAYAVAVGSSGVYVTGMFRSQSAAFGPLRLSNFGVEDMFITKLTEWSATSASVTWAERMGGSQSEEGRALAVVGRNVYVAGSYHDGTLGSTILPVASGANLFVTKVEDGGPFSSIIWAKAAGGVGYNSVAALAVQGSSLYLAGYFSGTATFGTTSLTSTGGNDVLVAKLLDAGYTASFAWAQRAGGTGNDRAEGLAVSGSSVYVAGSFEGSAAGFGPATLASAGADDAFVAKLDEGGAGASFGWAQRYGGTGADKAAGLVAAGPQLCVAGTFQSPTLPVGATSLLNAGGGDVFVARLVDAGPSVSTAWARQGGGANGEIALSVSLGAGGRVYVAGGAAAPSAFGPFAVTGPAGSSVGFVATLTDATLTATTPATRGTGIALFPNPASRSTTVQLPTGTGPVALTLLDALGRTVRTEQVAFPTTGLRHELDLTGLVPGVYALRVQAGEASAVRNLVVE